MPTFIAIQISGNSQLAVKNSEIENVSSSLEMIRATSSQALVQNSTFQNINATLFTGRFTKLSIRDSQFLDSEAAKEFITLFDSSLLNITGTGFEQVSCGSRLVYLRFSQFETSGDLTSFSQISSTVLFFQNVEFSIDNLQISDSAQGVVMKKSAGQFI